MATLVTPATLVAAVRGELDDVWDQVSDAVERTIRVGEASVKEFISTRGTAKSGKRGRIETGAMLRAVRSRKVRFNKSAAEGLFGLGNGPYYSLYQEYGFRHNRSGMLVEGMFAVVDSREVARIYLQAQLKGIR